MKNVLLLLNACAGSGKVKLNTFQMIESLTKQGYKTTVYPIIPRDNLEAKEVITEEVLKDYDLLAVSGGDGTLNRIMSLLIDRNIDIPLLYIPAGTTNDMSRALQIPSDIEKNCALVNEGELFSMDIGKLNTRYFNYVAAFGAFTNVSYDTQQSLKSALGYGAYLLSGVINAPEALNTKCHLKVITDNEEFEGDFFVGTVSNSTSVAGVKTPVIQKSKLNDGLFEVLLVKVVKDVNSLIDIVNALNSDDPKSDAIKIFRTSSLTIISDDDLPWTLDGEYGGSFKESKIEVLPKRIRIYKGR